MCDGSVTAFPYLNLHSFLHAGYKAGGALFDLLKDVSTFGVILYSDEVCPGNALAASNLHPGKVGWFTPALCRLASTFKMRGHGFL